MTATPDLPDWMLPYLGPTTSPDPVEVALLHRLHRAKMLRHNAVADVLRLCKGVEDGDGSWSGGDVVQVLSDWLVRHNIDPDMPADQIDAWEEGTRPAAPAR